MLKNLKYLFIAVFPYYILLVFFCLIGGYIGKYGLEVLVSIGVFYLVALICSTLAFGAGFSKMNGVTDLLRANLIIKLIHIPAYVMLFILGFLSTITIFTIGFSVVVIILDALIIFLSGMVGLGGILRGLKENRISKREAVKYGIMQFVFCLDVLSAYKIYRSNKILI